MVGVKKEEPLAVDVGEKVPHAELLAVLEADAVPAARVRVAATEGELLAEGVDKRQAALLGRYVKPMEHRG